MKKQIVNKSKENWVKVFNSLEGELNLEYSIKVSEMYKNKEERCNKTIADLYEILDIFEKGYFNERSYSIVEKSGDVFDEVFKLNKEIEDELVEINKKLWADKDVLKNKIIDIAKWNLNKKQGMLLINRLTVLDNRLKNTIENSYKEMFKELDQLNNIYSEIGNVLNKYTEEDKEIETNELKEVKNKITKPYLRSFREMENYLNNLGFKFDKVGRHHNFKNEFGDKLPVPKHSKDLGKGISKTILKEAENINKNRGIN